MSEHDYTTYILTDDVQELDNNVDGQVVYIQELTQEDILNGVTVEDLDYTLYEVPENTYNTISSRPTFRKSKYDGFSGYWSEEDVHRLLKIYLKHIKRQPLLGGKPNFLIWRSILLEFDVTNKFSRMQVKSKIARLKKFGQEIEKNNQQSTSKWPFWKAVSEILTLERSGSKPTRSNLLKPKETWSTDELMLLLKEYRRHLGEMFQCTSNAARRSVWSKIAHSLKRPRHQISLKFQSLKAKWRRWKKAGVKVSGSLELVLNEMNKVMATESVGIKTKKVTVQDVALKGVRNKWTADCTEIVLKMYEEKLRILKDTGVIRTRRSIYNLIAEEINLPLQLVQVKIASIKTHYKKVIKEGRTLKKCKWQFGELLKSIVSLERQIWLQLDESSDEVGEEIKTKHSYTEPAWFRRYRDQVEKRHKDNVEVLSRLLSVLEKLAKS